MYKTGASNASARGCRQLCLNCGASLVAVSHLTWRSSGEEGCWVFALVNDEVSKLLAIKDSSGYFMLCGTARRLALEGL